MCLVRMWSFLYSDFITGVFGSKAQAILQCCDENKLYSLCITEVIIGMLKLPVDSRSTCSVTHHHYQSRSPPEEGYERGSGADLSEPPAAVSHLTFQSASQHRAGRGSPSLSHWSTHKCTIQPLLGNAFLDVWFCRCLGEKNEANCIYEWGKAQCEFFRNLFIQKINITLQQN